MNSFNPCNNLGDRHCSDPHTADEEIEARKGEVSYPRSWFVGGGGGV